MGCLTGDASGAGRCYIVGMAQKPKRPRDTNQLARFVVGLATDDPDITETLPPDDGKNPAAVALGRLGGLKGGKARKDKLSPERRAEIAKKAAAKRWGKD